MAKTSTLRGYFTRALVCSAALIAVPSNAANSVQHQQFFESIATLCGQAFAGKITAGGSEGDGFSGKALIMHVRECSDTELKVPFHVGEDHSRTWVITQTDTGLRLKHDHRHKDGSEDKVTMYGGDTRDVGTANMQSFPVDDESIVNFKQNGLDQSVTNVWQMMIEAHTFTYRLMRENRDFRVEFDLTKPVALPPVPWGHE
ncbi:hypothetical protein GCM10009347_40170 [Shewanella algicola]|uniref:Secreted protein n=1 Tax=Shewanella algicola TaxID=640633 RepID=A0A9X1ZBC1_9GAMM|nr:hypothetical protein [Shewanella algicola]MCL1107639.1 hypothetical protein [Shewanella algicola]GGP71077.1 hypothetical protein GCM10009347_40170 [Shewanella algicola]